jgi:hypothetical protein
MQTKFRIQSGELPKLIALLKTLLSKEEEIEVTVKPTREPKAREKESKQEYWDRIDRTINNLEQSENVVSFTEEELEEYSNKLTGK